MKHSLHNYTILAILTRWLSAAVKILAIFIISVSNQVCILKNDSVMLCHRKDAEHKIERMFVFYHKHSVHDV